MSVVNYTPPPTVAKFMQSDARVRLLTGPVGSAKSTGCVFELVRRASMQAPGKDGKRRSRFLIIRNTVSMLRDTTLKTVMDWLPPGEAGTWSASTLTYTLRMGDIVSEWLFRPLDTPDDVRRLLSLEPTGAWINEFREVPEEIVTGVRSRLGRYPSAKDGGPTWYGLIADSNMPDADTYWYNTLSDLPEGWEWFSQPGGMEPTAENRSNLPESYYEDMMIGASQDWIDVHVHAKFGRSLSGRPVYERSFIPEFHIAKEPLIPLRSAPVIVGMDFGRCYDDQTDVLTEAGWKRFCDVDPALDRVATMNPTSFQLEYTDINFKTEFDYEGDMLEWAGTNVNFCVTPEHQVPFTKRESPTQLRFASAEQLAGELTTHNFVHVATATPWTGGKVQDRYVCGFNAATYAAFMGWYLSEGCYDKPTNRVTIAQSKIVPELEKCLQDTGLRWHPQTKSDGTPAGYRCSNAELNEYLAQFGGSYQKFLPPELKELPPEYLAIFVDAFTRGDGNRRTRKGHEEHTVFSVSERMMDDMQELALKMGWSSSKRFMKPQRSTMPCGRVIENSGIWVVQFKKKWTRAELLVDQFRRKHYSGKIYCLNVPYHTLYVRRNGKPGWNGNTPAAVFKQMDVKGRVLTFGSLWNSNSGLENFLRQEVIPYIQNRFPENRVLVVGDPAGWDKSQLNEETVADVFKRCNLRAVPSTVRDNNVEKRIAGTERWLSQQIEGAAAYLVCPTATRLLTGFKHGYRYRRKTDGSYEDKPCKTGEWGTYSHEHDANQYADIQIALGGGGAALTTARRNIEVVPMMAFT